ncbi:hypothetical protein HMPREF0322_00903 [Desulfitobacterium hafniense DP7]|uniref:Uncharacterized protein n=1 Tax=Desulfitobacterium hafniense DP7 TaxID=537010 RepID=G9XIX8_DESHA|nr:hypothetical protein HMPREF0322_00903 [Desulfitobacterium hafniense DP7]
MHHLNSLPHFTDSSRSWQRRRCHDMNSTYPFELLKMVESFKKAAIFCDR